MSDVHVGVSVLQAEGGPALVYLTGGARCIMEANRADAKRWYKCKRSGDGWLVTRRFIKPRF